MKRVVTLLMTVVLLLTVTVQAMAVGFVPSIGYKGAPALVSSEDGYVGVIKDSAGKELSKEEADCIVITPVAEAETSKDLSYEEQKVFLAVYKELKEKGIEIFPELKNKNIVVRDLFNISSDCDKLNEFLPKEGNTLNLTFNLNLGKKANIEAMLYADGKWAKMPVVNNADGTVTVTFEKLGIVAFLVEGGEAAPDTGDHSAKDLALWIGLMVASAGAIVALLVVALRKKSAK